MKKTVLVYGLIAGAISAALMLATLPFMSLLDKWGAVVGYTGMLLAAMLVFFGVRSYRENAAGGRLTFWRGLAVGLLITGISGLCYTLTWELLYFKFMPGLGDKLAAQMLERARTSAGTPQEVEAATRQARSFREWYDKPLLNAAVTFTEPLPVGLIVSAISAGILRRKQGAAAS